MTTEQLTAVVDTAAPVSLDTAPPAVETQPLGTESVAPAVETDSASTDEATETADPLAEFDDELLKGSPKVKALLDATEKSVTARSEESHRQQLEQARKAEAERATQEQYAQRLKEVDEVQTGSIVSQLASVIDEVAYGDPEARTRLQANMPKLREMAEVLNRTTATRLDRDNVDTLNSFLTSKYPDYRIPPDKVSAFDAALAKGDFATRRQIELDLAGDARLESERQTMRASLARELKADAEQQLANERTKAQEAAATTRGGPTTVAGRPAAARDFQTLRQVDEARVAGQITNADVRRFRAMGLPEF